MSTPNRFLGLLRASALIAVVAGAAGTLALLYRATHRTPTFLRIIFVFWNVSPFVVLVVADVLSKRWAVVTRATLYIVMLVVAFGSLVIYANDSLRPAGTGAAFLWVIVPPASWLLIGIVVAAGAFVCQGRSRFFI